MNGIITNADTCHKRKVAVNPITKHYEDPGETPYVKYSCPVCSAVGNSNISITEGSPRCPLCGVALNWDREPELGDTVVILTELADKYFASIFPKGTTGTITSIMPSCSSPYRITNTYNKMAWFPGDAFSVLEEDA